MQSWLFGGYVYFLSLKRQAGQQIAVLGGYRNQSQASVFEQNTEEMPEFYRFFQANNANQQNCMCFASFL